MKKGDPKEIKPLPPQELLNRLYEISIDEQGIGRLRMRMDYPWHKNGKRKGEWASRGETNFGYRAVTVGGHGVKSGGRPTYLEHRLIWKMVHGRDPVFGIDHIDRNKRNNNPENLRDVPDIENIWNRTPKLEHRHICPEKSRRGYVVSLPRLSFSTLDDAKQYRDLMVKTMIDLANKFNRSRLLRTPKEAQCVKAEQAEMSLKDGRLKQILMPLISGV